MTNLTDDQWKALNWDASDAIIAFVLGYSREGVGQRRETLGIPKLTKIVSQRSLEFGLWVKEKGEALNGKSVTEILKEYLEAGHKNLSPQVAARILLDNKVALKFGQLGRLVQYQTSIPWHLVNWDLPNTLLARIWYAVMGVAHMSTQHFASQRWRYQKGPAKFKAWNTPEDLLNAERVKASEWWTKERFN